MRLFSTYAYSYTLIFEGKMDCKAHVCLFLGCAYYWGALILGCIQYYRATWTMLLQKCGLLVMANHLLFRMFMRVLTTNINLTSLLVNDWDHLACSSRSLKLKQAIHVTLITLTKWLSVVKNERSVLDCVVNCVIPALKHDAMSH